MNNENETDMIVLQESGNDDAAACQSTTASGDSNFPIFDEVTNDIPASGGSTTVTFKGNGAAKAAIHKRKKKDKMQKLPPNLNVRYASLKSTIESQTIEL